MPYRKDHGSDKGSVVGKLASFCHATAVTRDAITAPADDPTASGCYAIKDAKAQPKLVKRSVTIVDAFRTAAYHLKKAARLCVPSSVGSTPPQSMTRLKCYKIAKAKGTPAFVPVRVTLDDGFDTRIVDVTTPSEVCAIVDLGTTFKDVSGGFICYGIKDAKTSPKQPKLAPRTLEVDNVFYPGAPPADTRFVTLEKQKQLCVGADVL